MSEKPSFWQRLGLHDWFVNKPAAADRQERAEIDPDALYQFILKQFDNGVRELSFANRVVFYQEYVIVLHADDYAAFQERRKGLLGMIAQECVSAFHQKLRDAQQAGRTVVPAAQRWVFRFVSHPGYAPGDLGFIGKLLPTHSGVQAPQEQLRVTYIPRQTGMAETSELAPETLSAFTYYSEGYYELPLKLTATPGVATEAADGTALARFEAVVPDREYAGKKIEFRMRGDELTLSGPADSRSGEEVFRIPSEWVDTPHLRIRYARNEQRFFLASFGEKTVVNEREVARSAPQQPSWTELPFNSRIVLNGIVGVNFYKA